LVFINHPKAIYVFVIIRFSRSEFIVTFIVALLLPIIARTNLDFGATEYIISCPGINVKGFLEKSEIFFVGQ